MKSHPFQTALQARALDHEYDADSVELENEVEFVSKELFSPALSKYHQFVPTAVDAYRSVGEMQEEGDLAELVNEGLSVDKIVGGAAYQQQRIVNALLGVSSPALRMPSCFFSLPAPICVPGVHRVRQWR